MKLQNKNTKNDHNLKAKKLLLHIHCPACKNTNFHQIFKVSDKYYGSSDTFEYVQCEDCKSIWNKDFPENIEQFYPESYHCHGTNNSTAGNVLYTTLLYLKYLSKYVRSKLKGDYYKHESWALTFFGILRKTKVSFGDKIIDVGCGGGNLLLFLKRLGYKNLVGIDPYLPNSLKNTSNPVFYKNEIFAISKSFDTIIFNHSLEHIKDQDAVFNHLKKITDRRSKVIIRIPISNSKAQEIFNENWYQIDAPRHYILYSITGLKKIAKQHGFMVVSLGYDSSVHQFLRSKVYESGMTSKSFLNQMDGDYSKLISIDEISRYQKMTSTLNKTEGADQACFLLKRI